jgi:hypothetical protein
VNYRAIFRIVLLLTFNAALSACGTAGASGAGLTFTLSNQTASAICEVYVTAQESNDWGENLISAGDEISPGSQRVFQKPAGTYDLLAMNCDGIPVHSTAAVSADAVITIGGAGTSPLTVENAANSEICYLYLANAGEGDWGADQLGGVESILPGASRIFYHPTGSLQARAEDCAHQVIQEASALELTGALTWTIGSPLQ